MQHANIARAVLEGNGDEAATLMRQHMDEFHRCTTERIPGVFDRSSTGVDPQ